MYLRGNLRVRLATERKSLRKFNLRPLATTCRSVFPGLKTITVEVLCFPGTGAWRVDLLFSLYSTETSFAMDTKCAIKSSCSPLGCHPPEHTDPITVNPASNITLNCTIITGELVRNMTWNQTLKRVKNSTGTKLSNLVLEQSNSTKSDGKYSCRCTTIKLARKCFLIQPWHQLKTIKIIFLLPSFPGLFPLKLAPLPVPWERGT